MIEVAIPLEAINEASAREKSIRHGHPSTIHLWWARRPLAAARAVIFCQMVDDPSSVPEEFPTEEDQERERLKLFALVSELVLWESTTNMKILDRAREEINKSWKRCCSDNKNHPSATELYNPKKPPAFHDPFAGGGALPLEAQRLGLDSYASDLNPVAVVINKAMIEIPSRFSDIPPVNLEVKNKKNLLPKKWKGAEGLADDVRHYAQWMRDEAERKIGNLYPKIRITSELIEERPDLKPYEGQQLTVITWLWARTVKSVNPSFNHIEVPLTNTFILSKKPKKEAYVQPIIENNSYHFIVRKGKPENFDTTKLGTSAGKRAAFRCLMSSDPIDYDYIAKEAQAGRMNARLMAIVVQGKGERIYLSPTIEQEKASRLSAPIWKPNLELCENKRDLAAAKYGLNTFSDLFTSRQLIGLTTFSDLLQDVKRKIETDMKQKTLKNSAKNSNEYENESKGIKYSEAIILYLAFVVDKCSDYWSTICSWHISKELIRNTFSRQSISITWDFVEVNPFSKSSGNWSAMSDWVSKALINTPASGKAQANQLDASKQLLSKNKVISTDPPYYDNIAYADLSDFFYSWLRRPLKNIFPELFSTVATPKKEELVASPYRHGNKDKAELFFLNGMTQAMQRLADTAHQSFPITIYYAFKQAETKNTKGTASTGWETFLTAVIKSGLSIKGTWPIRTELSNRMIGSGTNALASSIVLVCQKRDTSAKIISRNDFRRELRHRLPKSIHKLERSNIAPVDIAQASIGPGMAIYSQVKAVIKPDDTSMSVREALIEINNALDEYLSKNEGSLDAESRFALIFFESFGYKEQPYGKAEGLAKALNVSVEGVAKSGVINAIGGKAMLVRREELESQWDPSLDNRLCIWESTQYLIKTLEEKGESAAASLLHQLHQITEHDDLPANCRALAYRLYNHCDKTKQTEEARAYNSLIIAWPELQNLALTQHSDSSPTIQTKLL